MLFSSRRPVIRLILVSQVLGPLLTGCGEGLSETRQDLQMGYDGQGLGKNRPKENNSADPDADGDQVEDGSRLDAAPHDGAGQPNNAFAKVQEGALRVVLTDVSGPLACISVDDPQLSLSHARAQIYASFALRSDGRCPTDVTYALAPVGSCSGTFPQGINCARLRRWDAAGQLTEETLASGGALMMRGRWVDSLWSACTIDLELVFPGGIHVNHSFEVYYTRTDQTLPNHCE